MSFFKRLKNVVEAKANKALDKHENPVEALELSIRKKESLLQDAKKQCAQFIASIDGMEKEHKDIKNKIDKYEEAVKVALQKNEEQKAHGFVKQKLELQEKLNESTNRINAQKNTLAEVKSKIEVLDLEISKMKNKKSELATRLEVAEVSASISETLNGMSDDHGVNIDELEKKVIQKENYGKAVDSMKTKTEEEVLDEYISDSPSVDASISNELERIKKEMNK